jgi:hypothetical protein
VSEVSASSRFMLTRDVEGKTVGFAAVRGEVVNIERWTETRVSTAGGSVHVHGNQVSVSPPKVWATAVGRKAIWVRSSADEVQVPVPEDLQVRQGHRVQAVIATGVDNGASQWAAIVNHDTNRWTQVDRSPPSGCYDPWTSVVMGFGQGMGNVAMGIMCLYAAILGAVFTLIGQSGMSLVWGVFLGLGAGFVHSLVGIFQSKAAVTAYSSAVKAACDHLFAADA